MRTTINISEALLHELKQKSAEENRNLNAVIEEALRVGLNPSQTPTKEFKVKARKLGVKAAYRGISMNQLYDQIEVEEYLKKLMQ